jgi:hypothetical protein
MQARHTLLLFAIAAAAAPAAEGLTFVTAYLSDPVSVTEAMVKACTSRHPELAAQGAAALESWRRRNAADVRGAAELAAREIEKLPLTQEEANRTLVQLRQEHLEGWERIAAFPTACSDYLASLERPESDISRHLPPREGATADDVRLHRLAATD